MRRSRALHLCLLTILLVALGSVLLRRGEEHLVTWELRAGDSLARYGRKTPPDPKIIFLAIDGRSITLDAETDLPDLVGEHPDSTEAGTLRMMTAPWPWSRAIYPRVLDRLFAAGAAVVVFDINFVSATAVDTEFRASLEKYRDRVVIGSHFEDATGVGIQHPHTPPSDTLIPVGNASDSRVGFTNFWTDLDEVVRDTSFHASVLTLSGRRDESDQLRTSLAGQAIRQLGHPELVPTDTAPHTLRLAGEPDHGFPPRSIYEIFVPEYWRRNYANGGAFRDAVVVIGAAGDWQHDALATSLGTMPGPELQCTAINSLLHGGFVRRAPLWLCLTEIIAAGLLALALALAAASPLARVAALTLCAGAFGGLALWLYNQSGLILAITTPLGVFATNGLGGLLYDLIAVRNERRRLRSTFERYVSRNVVGELMGGAHSSMHELGGVVRPVTILFSDIRNFTRVCAQTQPQILVEQLNEYLTVMVDCAFRFRGTLDKFIGDAVMVVWGNVCTEGVAEDARQALRCALAMQKELARLNARWEAEGREPIRIGIALNHGEVVAGNIGSPHRMEFTVIGDAVNVCWRLQERTKLHAGGLILGETLGPLLGADYPTENLGSIVVGETLESNYLGLVQAPA